MFVELEMGRRFGVLTTVITKHYIGCLATWKAQAIVCSAASRDMCSLEERNALFAKKLLNFAQLHRYIIIFFIYF